MRKTVSLNPFLKMIFFLVSFNCMATGIEKTTREVASEMTTGCWPIAYIKSPRSGEHMQDSVFKTKLNENKWRVSAVIGVLLPNESPFEFLLLDAQGQNTNFELAKLAFMTNAKVCKRTLFMIGSKTEYEFDLTVSKWK